MVVWTLDFPKIERWAYSDVLDKEFEQWQEEDCDLFEHMVSSHCGLDSLVRFAGDPACLKRPFFAQLLLPYLSWIFSSGPSLPFHLSRFAGLVKSETFFEQSAKHAEEVYKIAGVIDRMRCSDDALLQALANIIYDFRNDWRDVDNGLRMKLTRTLHEKVNDFYPPSESK